MNHGELSDLASKRQGELQGLELCLAKPCCNKYSVSVFICTHLTGLTRYACCLIGLAFLTTMSCWRTVVRDGTSLKRQGKRPTKLRMLRCCSSGRSCSWDGSVFNVSEFGNRAPWVEEHIANPSSGMGSEDSVTLRADLLWTAGFGIRYTSNRTQGGDHDKISNSKDLMLSNKRQLHTEIGLGYPKML